jgi:[CysO sulfur-carrier protein]-S-L-cysteine hydrolase
MRLEVTQALVDKMRADLKRAGRQEIGGMLFAEQLAPNRFKIVDCSTDFHSGSHSTFRRDPVVHNVLLRQFFERTGNDFRRFNYLGEWHSHPSFSVRPSPEDVAEMTGLVQDNKSGISFAVLLVVRIRFRLWLDASATLFARDHAPAQVNVGVATRWI